MKVLILHNQYQQRGGEDVVVENETRLLREHGHTVEWMIESNDRIASPVSKLLAATRVGYSKRSYLKVQKKIQAFQPDIVHVHNWFPLLTPSVLWGAHDAGVPVVQTLHNYRTICGAATFVRHGRICEICIQGSPIWGARNRCYRKSVPGSLAVAKMIMDQRKARTFERAVDVVVALTGFAKKKFVEGDVAPENRIQVKPNFVFPEDREELPPGFSKREGVLFAGRLSPEKGVKTLMKAWKDVAIPLRVIGSAQDPKFEKELRSLAPSNVEFLGQRSASEVRRWMRASRALVFPSEWYEGFPMVIAEAYAEGLPVLASAIGGIPEIVRHGETGYLFSPGEPESLQEWIPKLDHLPTWGALSETAYHVFESAYSPEAGYRNLMRIYEIARMRRNPTISHSS